MHTKGDIVTINLYDGKVDPVLNNKFNFISVLDHEGGPTGHLMNPDKKHSEIYKDQISKYSGIITPDLKKTLQDNFKSYKAQGD
jgi:hypothetical protein